MNYTIILLTIIQICTFIGYFPQIIKTLKLKKSEDVAISSWVIGMISVVCYLIYGIIINDKLILITCITEVILSIITVIILVKYSKVSKEK